VVSEQNRLVTEIRVCLFLLPVPIFKLSGTGRRLKSCKSRQVGLPAPKFISPSITKMFGRSMFDIFDPYGFDEDIGFGRSRYTFGGEVDRRSFAAVSDRALRAHNDVSIILMSAFRRVF
jgi:hypothetical protein